MDPVKAKANYSRVCQLLIDKGGIALRGALHAVHPPSTLSAVLNTNKATLLKMRKRVINDPQWDLLFPASGSPDSNNFDITLLTILLRNICALPSPTTGWDVMPPPSDSSISADIARIKILRNEIYGHISRAEYDNTKFEKYWQDVSGPLIRLGIPQKDIDQLKVAPLSPEEESYFEKLKEWKEVEDELLSRLADLENEFFNLRRAVETASTSKLKQLAKCDFTLKINDLCKKFQDGTRQWFFDQLSSWFNDKESRVMILTARPGIGKSVLFAKICELYKQYDELAACHFCDFKKSDYSNPHIILESLAAQMCDNVDGYREKLNEVLNRKHSRDSLSDAFRVLLQDPLHDLIRTEPMLIVIDALDESKIEVKSEFLELIADEFEKLPKWIKILISSRPELQVRKKLELLNPLEILPDDEHHLEDLNHFIKSSLQNVSEINLHFLISKCEDSFLYAYYLVNELKQGGQGFEPITKDYTFKGIAGFYHKQFTRLKTSLQRFKPNESSILKSFRNVIAASKEPLPCKIFFTCMGLSGEEFEIREMIIGIMSEIIPIYDNCLTVYHKSLWDWLTLNGYEEHAFVADIEDGEYRLWQACENVYRDIVSLRSISDFQTSPETSYALKYGEKLLFDVGCAEDFHWLVNVRLNFLKLQLGKELKFSSIFEFSESKISNHFNYSVKNDMDAFKDICNELNFEFFCFEFLNFESKEPDFPYIYLQSLVKGYSDFVRKANDGKNEAREILYEKRKLWVEEVGNEYIPENKIISYAILGNRHPCSTTYALAVSPDNKLIAYKYDGRIVVFGLPNLSWVFSLEIKDSQKEFEFLQFSPDSLYLVWNSARFCLSLTSQKEVPLIPQGPENVDCVSFSPCGMRLVTCEKKLIKLWDVKTKDLLTQSKTDFDIFYSIFSDCNSYVFGFAPNRYFLPQLNLNDVVAIFSSITLERLDTEKISCSNQCLTKEDIYQILSPRYLRWERLTDNPMMISHFHSPTGRIYITSNNYCSNPFEWEGKKCVMYVAEYNSSLVIYDLINEVVVDVFHIDCLPTQSSFHYISILDGTNFLVVLNDNQAFVLSLEALRESCERETRFVSASNIKCYALSPDDSYIACCYEDLILTVINVINGTTFQSFELKHRPEACWWSEFYYWMICKGVVVKYPYNLTQTKVLGNEIEECSINFESVVVFMNGVLVIRTFDNTGICMLKICNKKLYTQQIPNAKFSASSASVSSDGFAVLLYRESSSDYQLWETAGKHRWELRSFGAFNKDDEMAWYCLTGKENSRTSVWLTFKLCRNDCNYKTHLDLSSIDFGAGTKTSESLLLSMHDKIQVIYVNSKIFILHKGEWIHFIRVANGERFTLLYVGRLRDFRPVASFFLASQGLLLLGGERSVKIFKIHNIENILPDLIED